MEWSHYSPHREAGGVLHLPSPTHGHSYHVEALQKLRRSLSRSPSKTPRFHLQTGKSPKANTSTPSSPLARTPVSPAFGRDHTLNPAPPSPLAVHASTTSKGKKFALRRVGPFRASPRTNNSPRSPVRRALADNSNQGNVTPSGSRRSSGDENAVPNTKESEAKTPLLRLDLNDGPIKFEFSRSKQENLAPADRSFLAKSSPLKRIDGRMNLDQSNFGSPAKRRSLHGASAFGPDFDVFSQDAMSSGRFEMAGSNDVEKEVGNSFASSHPKRASSLRKSTLQSRHPRTRQSTEHQFDSPQSTPAQKARNRVSMDCSLLMGPPMQSPFLRPQPSSQPTFTPRPAPRRRPSHPPHPLSYALTASTSGSSNVTEDTYMETKSDVAVPPAAPKVLRSHVFTKSLPIGSSRPKFDFDSQESSQSSFDTPTSYKSAKPNQRAFMSTGLISKKNRNIETAADVAQYAMPDTPSKRYSYPPDTASPLHGTAAKKPARPSLEFGTPNTPFGSSGLFGKSNLFAAPPFGTNASGRRRSFLSLEGEDASQSPTANHDSQSSADELPPTPTKPAGKNGKESSLRSSLFGRRTSLAPDTFVPPGAADAPAAKEDVRISIPIDVPDASGRTSPHTPHESFTPPDPSGLSISGKRDFGFSFLTTSTNSNPAFPPATPTAPRDYQFPFSSSTNIPVAAVTENDVDVCLSARFGKVNVLGTGEFSKVFRVADPLHRVTRGSPLQPLVFAVKKAKHAFTGQKDRERKMKEVEILRSLRCNEHVIEYVDSWVDKGHLYIQTEYCENGNLFDFLKRVGNLGRLDDFRIWKILLELTLGVKHIHQNGFVHLDLKPSNIFITYEGVLRIGDFGLASPWPVPRHTEAEGDRYYIAQEVLDGTYDKPGDIFALGLIIAEIAANVELPANGTSWQKLRQGDLGEFPSLTWSSDSSLARNEDGDPISPRNTFFDDSDDEAQPFSACVPLRRAGELHTPPPFMVEPDHSESLDFVVQWMVSKPPSVRPTIDQVYQFEGVRWVEARRRSGATVYEGCYGPADDVLNHSLSRDVEVEGSQDVDMTDV